MKFKYRLSDVSIKKSGWGDVYKYSHNEYQIFKKGLFGWKKYLGGIKTKEQGLRILIQLTSQSHGSGK